VRQPACVASTLDDILFVVLGEQAPTDFVNGAEIEFIPYDDDPVRVAQFYQAASVYVHPARVDTFPDAVLEAMACGRPVVASSVGGIPEQVVHEKTELLVPAGDAEAMALCVIRLLKDRDLRTRMGGRGAMRVAQRFDLEAEVASYMAWYEAVVSRN